MLVILLSVEKTERFPKKLEKMHNFLYFLIKLSQKGLPFFLFYIKIFKINKQIAFAPRKKAA